MNKYKVEDFETMAPMKYYNNEDVENKKRMDMIDNKDDKYMATEKHDGDWGMFIHYERGHNLIRSRSISKVTGKYGDYTEKLPHLVEEMDSWPDNTVVLAEICWNEYGTNANTVGTILRCLPPKAVERQKDKKLFGLVFDMLMFDGKDLTFMGYETRFNQVRDFFGNHGYSNFKYFMSTRCFENNFAQHADEIIAAGGEGVVIQLKDNPYMPGTRTAWKTLKLKQKLDEMELPVVSLIEPNRYYEGKDLEHWPYWEVFTGYNMEDPETGELTAVYDYRESDDPVKDQLTLYGDPVTKPFYYGWANGVVVWFNGTYTRVTSGLTDDDRKWLATFKARQAMDCGDLYAVVRAMSVNDKGALRHPYLVKLRLKEDGAGE